MPLDFKRATDLFLGSEKELALALALPLGDLRDYRQNPERTPEALVRTLGQVLVERGNGMRRVGEMLLDDGGASGQPPDGLRHPT